MPVHDWRRVEAGIFHDFTSAWIIALRNSLNQGLLPRDDYALAEQHGGPYIGDVLALHPKPVSEEPLPPLPADAGGTAVGSALPEMPLFLRPDRYINTPLEATYQSAYDGMPAYWREVLERAT